jgi:hypothetical protein
MVAQMSPSPQWSYGVATAPSLNVTDVGAGMLSETTANAVFGDTTKSASARRNKPTDFT